MKTSLIKETDSYTYALKIGFSFDSSKNAYVVNQIIKSGTGLTSESKTAEYYILVHSDNATAYQELSLIALGDVIYSNKDFQMKQINHLMQTLQFMMQLKLMKPNIM